MCRDRSASVGWTAGVGFPACVDFLLATKFRPALGHRPEVNILQHEACQCSGLESVVVSPPHPLYALMVLYSGTGSVLLYATGSYTPHWDE